MDIIFNLQRRKLLGEIAVEILQYLDVNDLNAAEKVSTVWREAIINGKLWEKLFKQNVMLHPPWKKMNSIVGKQKINCNSLLTMENDDEQFFHEQMCYKKICLEIADSLNILDKNWETFNYQEEIVLRGPVIDRPVNSITFLMDEKQIVRHVDSEKTFQFFNRWSLELEETIPSRIDLTGNNHQHCFVTCFDFSDDLLAVGYGNGVVDVVGRKSIETLHTFRDFDWPHHERDGLDDSGPSFATEKVILSPKQQFLLSYLYTRTSYFLTLRKIENINEMTIAHQLQLGETVEELVNLYMDDTYTVLFIRSRVNEGPSEEMFEIRSTESFTPLRTFPVQGVVSAYNYLNGLLVIGKRIGKHQFLRVWDVKTGVSIWNVDLDNEKIVDLRIISDKFIVSVDHNGELKQWDLHTVLDHAVPADQALLHRIGSSKNLSSCVGGGMVADEYQVVLFGFFRTAPIKGQKETPIVVSLDFMKGQNRVKKPLPQLY